MRVVFGFVLSVVMLGSLMIATPRAHMTRTITYHPIPMCAGEVTPPCV